METIYNERTGEHGVVVHVFRPEIQVSPNGDMSTRVMREPFEVIVDVVRGDYLVRESWWTSDGLSIIIPDKVKRECQECQ